jgi:hypothetical protein
LLPPHKKEINSFSRCAPFVAAIAKNLRKGLHKG